jgi:phytoene synthase
VSTTLREAYAACRRLAASHYENFPVASFLLPASVRPHVAAIYAFARIADDLADDPGRGPTDRLWLLDQWRQRLHATPDQNHAPDKNAPPDKSASPDKDSSAVKNSSPDKIHVPDAVFLALHDTIARFDLPVWLFDDLLSAFRQDVDTSRYERWADVLDYCRRSANPVGRLVLRLFGYRDEALDRASDAVCTALQLTNFWQDLAVDWSRGRLYVPAEIWRAHGANLADLDGEDMTPEWRAALGDCAARTRQLFGTGRAVCDGVSGRLRWELRATWLGGRRILDRLERRGFDAFTTRVGLGPLDAVPIGWGVLTWRKVESSRVES